MRTIGIFGGMAYSSTSSYYTMINDQVQRKLGGINSAELLIQSFNFSEMTELFCTGKWDVVLDKFLRASKNLKNAGAECIIICCNTAHGCAEEFEKKSELPLLHIADFMGEILRERGITKIALLGSKPTMEGGFYDKRLMQKFGIAVAIPELEERKGLDNMIWTELAANIFHSGQKELMLRAVEQTRAQGAQAVVLACTELQLVLKPEDTDLPVFDTMEVHAMGAAKWALAPEGM